MVIPAVLQEGSLVSIACSPVLGTLVILLISSAIPIFAGPRPQVTRASLGESLKRDGRFDRVAARQSRYEGPVDPTGLKSRLDTETGELLSNLDPA